ncbi:ABC transporter family substrate-binding protein [Actinomycetes bacterium KLBMP 9759]
MIRLRAVLILIIGVMLAACTNAPVPSPQPATPTPTPTPQPEPTRIVVGVDDLPPGFNPHLIADTSPVTTALATLVLPSVFRIDAAGTPQLDPTIATSAEVTSTAPFTVSYELNLEASWSTNTPIAAEDFVYLWERMRGDTGVADAAGYRLITEVRSRAGGKAVDVVFAEPYPAWQRLFSNLLPAHVLKDAPGSWVGALVGGLPASGGPFKVLTVDRARGEVVLARNDLYWTTPSVVDQLAFRKLDASAIAAGFASGDVTVAVPEAREGIRTALGGFTPPPKLQPAPQPSVTQLGMRADAGPLADPRVRQGVAAIVDREAVRAAVAPEALAADAFGVAPSQPGYAATAPAGAPARPDPVAAAQLLTAAGWTREAGTGRWTVDGAPVRLVIGAAAERPQDREVAENVAAQLNAAGVGATVVVPPGVDLFGSSTVPAVTPSTTAQPTPTTTNATATTAPAAATTTGRRDPTPSAAPVPTPVAAPTTGPPATTSTTTAAAPAPTGGVEVDLMVMPRTVGGDIGTEMASDYGCPLATALVPEPPRSSTGFCFHVLQPLLDELVTVDPRPETAAAVERILWQQLPALPLFQPVSLVISTEAGETATGIGPGPLGTGPLTGAERWRPPAG